MSFVDALVAWREATLSRALRMSPRAVLNPNGCVAPVANASAVAGSLKRAFNALKAAGSDPHGDRVDYTRLRDRPEYTAFRTIHTASLRTLDLSTLVSRDARLAFWINLYNALVIDAVVAFGIGRSVSEGWAGHLAFFRRAAYVVSGFRFSCDDIEHGILRGNRGHPFIPGPQFGPSDTRVAFVVRPPDVRVHFALNCGSRSCPPIGVYSADQIDAQLDLATRSFIANDASLDRRQNVLTISRIFRWCAGDFGGREGVRAFLVRYLPEDERREWLRGNGGRTRIAYRSYDWRLNAA